ncbi:MAG: glutamyl-tRNA reductase [Gammaproteobacteria bacterium]|nr:MAG: glutamyl-tRNA reductase [Gammaproteobacteria bacterium]
MTLFACGVNHQSAPVSMRERIVFGPEELPRALTELYGCEGVEEAAILSTCNRTDLYLGLQAGGDRAVKNWFQGYHGLSADELARHMYTHQADGAVRHVMRVASGLDSMVLGEPQILGQLKFAYGAARSSGTVGTLLGRLFQQAFFVAKRVRTDTAIGSSPVSIAFAAVALARQILGDLSAHTALLIGAGETIELAVRHLSGNRLGRMIIANRTLENAHRLASQFGGYAIELSEIPVHLAEADIVIASTASAGTILGVELVRRAMKARKRRPVFMVDIAVPLDIDPAVGALEDVYLYTVDDLHEVIEENRRSRQDAARQAEEIIDQHVGRFMGWLGTRDVGATIRAVRGNAEDTRNQVLEKAYRRLAAGHPPEEVMHFLARALTNKLLHAPTVQIRRAGAGARHELVAAARTLYELESDPGDSADHCDGDDGAGGDGGGSNP